MPKQMTGNFTIELKIKSFYFLIFRKSYHPHPQTYQKPQFINFSDFQCKQDFSCRVEPSHILIFRFYKEDTTITQELKIHTTPVYQNLRKVQPTPPVYLPFTWP